VKTTVCFKLDGTPAGRAWGRIRRCRSAPNSRRAPEVEGLANRIRARLRDTLLVTTEIMLAPAGSLPRNEYKSTRVETL